MASLTDHKLQRILTRFPWRRRKPRSSSAGAPISMTTREGQKLWADPMDLATFEDPGPALVCVALHSDRIGRTLVRSLVLHHAQSQGIDLPAGVPDVTTKGLEVLGGLIVDAGLDPEVPLGAHPIGELLRATWAIAAATERKTA
jgi:hypothetical protein